MTLDQYRRQIYQELRRAESTLGAQTVISEVSNTLQQSGISLDSQQDFWSQLYNDLSQVVEKQGASSLSVIVAAAQAAIAARLEQFKKQ